jgi:hypothetical protein
VAGLSSASSSQSLPTRSGLRVRLTAGDLTVEGIEGNKDIESHAGDLTIDVGRAEDYHRVDASLWAGDLQAPPFNVSKGGLFPLRNSPARRTGSIGRP